MSEFTVEAFTQHLFKLSGSPREPFEFVVGELPCCEQTLAPGVVHTYGRTKVIECSTCGTAYEHREWLGRGEYRRRNMELMGQFDAWVRHG